MKVDLQRVLELEDQFSQHHYRGDIHSSEPFKIAEGSIPILVSAPHATKHIRNGKIKSADVYTGALAKMLREETKCHMIVANQIGDDPNYVLEGSYKTTLKKYLETHSIHTVIDLHGASSKRLFDIELGNNFGKTMSMETIELISERMQKDGFNVSLNSRFPASHAGTVTSFIANQLEVEIVQVEINRDYRNPRKRLESFCKAAESLKEVVEVLSCCTNDRSKW